MSFEVHLTAISVMMIAMVILLVVIRMVLMLPAAVVVIGPPIAYLDFAGCQYQKGSSREGKN